jgi:signal transduction histidine kinase/CheY-like chemotaxis protein
MTQLDFSKDSLLSALFESFEDGIAIFDADRKLLYINKGMARVTGGSDASVGGSLSELAKRHRLRTEGGIPLEQADFPINHAFEGKETHNKPYIYIGSEGRPRKLLISCVRICDDAGTLRHVLTSVSDTTKEDSDRAKLTFMVEASKTLSLDQDFNARLVEKAKLAVPSLADWCAIDILKASGEFERVAVIHQDRKMIDYIFELERRFPPVEESASRKAMRTGTAQFVPLVTEDMLEAAAQSPAHLEAIKKLQLRSVLVIPICSRAEVLGAMTLAYAESGRTYSEDDFRFFKDFCSHLGVVLENARLYEEASLRDKAKDLFLASLSHELRNPLAPIKSSLELLKMKDAAPDVRAELDIIEHQFDHMAKLLNDLLDVTRFTQDKIEVQLRPVGLRRLVERALKASQALLTTADVSLHVRYVETSVPVSADETRLEQAITNLLSNATKYTPSGGSIWVTVGKEKDEAFVSVRDNGAGIEEDDLPNVFEMYFQGKRRRSISSGLGIGLLLVQKIVQLHDGAVEAHSDGPGKGSEFIIRLPLSKEPAPAAHATMPLPSHIAGKRVLIVDDNEQAADSLARLLGKLGATTATAYSGADTLAHPDLERFDLLLVDLGMPHMDGFELIGKLQARGVSAPVAALTGYGMQEDKIRTEHAGFRTHLTKPIGLTELRETFDTVFSS